MEPVFTISNGVLTFPEGTEGIDFIGFDGTEKVEKIIIPASAAIMCGLPTLPLHNLPDLKYLEVEEGNPVFDSRDNCNAVIHTATNTLMMGCATTVIPSTVVAIYDDAFCCCEGLKSLDLPESVKVINPTAFSNCFGLKAVVIPETVQLVDSFAFMGCDYLETVTFEGADTRLGRDIFRYCHKISKILVPEASVEKYKEQLTEDLQDLVIGV